MLKNWRISPTLKRNLQTRFVTKFSQLFLGGLKLHASYFVNIATPFIVRKHYAYKTLYSE